jgi:hypothetical protein
MSWTALIHHAVLVCSFRSPCCADEDTRHQWWHHLQKSVDRWFYTISGPFSPPSGFKTTPVYIGRIHQCIPIRPIQKSKQPPARFKTTPVALFYSTAKVIINFCHFHLPTFISRIKMASATKPNVWWMHFLHSSSVTTSRKSLFAACNRKVDRCAVMVVPWGTSRMR